MRFPAQPRRSFRRSRNGSWVSDWRPTSGARARGRRVRVLHLESLEHRALLAALQFAAGLGEQSTLDSVVQAENELPDVNSAGSQQFSHNDGTAFSTVTLTAGSSTTNNPGINLDLLSNGSVSKHGPANVSATAGLEDSSGNIGPTVSEPVTIVTSDASEQVGDPVDVQFAFSFNVKTFASNNATANFSYSVSYAYKGVTTPLAIKTYQIGGSGVTPIGSGPVDLETGTLHALIGDTFTLTIAENLSGQTIAPFLGGLVNNLGWLVDTNLDASVVPAKPSVVPRSLEWVTTAGGGVNFDYQVSGGILPNFVQVALYWASGTDFDNEDVLQEVPLGDDQPTIPAGTEPRDQPYGPIHVPGSDLTGAPDGSNYLLAVTDPDNTLGTFDSQLNVQDLQIKLPVRAVYQNIGPWVPVLYPLGRSTTQTIASSGCASVSLVMALDFAGVETDPITLNNLLTASQDGYTGTDTLNWEPATAIAVAGARLHGSLESGGRIRPAKTARPTHQHLVPCRRGSAEHSYGRHSFIALRPRDRDRRRYLLYQRPGV